MGGRNSKPVRTIKVEPAEGYNSACDNEEDRDELQTAKDTLGIVAAEQDYPEASPPGNDLQPILEDNELAETVSMVDDINTKSGVFEKGGTDAIVPVQIGTSLQKSLSKRWSEGSHFQKNENEAESLHGEVLMSTSVTSLQNTILAEQHLNLINKTLEKKRDQTTLTQRDALLLERESFLFRKLTEKSDSMMTSGPRGQVRLFESVRDLPDNGRDRKRPCGDFGELTANEAAEMHKDHRAKTFKSVIDDLTSGFKSDAVKVKAILAWICKQNIGQIDFGQRRFDPDTPNGYMQLMQEGKGTYPGFFALLCRAANIKCVIITGISKGAGYEVGNPNTDILQNAWNAVFIDDGWRLVHPLWVCKSLAGRRQGGWVTIESQGNFHNDVSNRNDGEVTYTYNDYFIFTKPEEFINRHFPDDPRWQLLPVPIPLDSFLARSYCRPTFFVNDFKILSDDQCVLVSEKGEPIEIVIGYPDTIASELVFGYELGQKLPENEDVKISSADYHKNYERFVFVSKFKARVKFEIRFAQRGVYKLRLFGGLYTEYDNKPPWIMDVKLVCNELAPKPVPLPFDPGIVGWGPGPIAENLGLFVPSHESSTIEVASDDVIVIQFILVQRMVFNITLRHEEIRPGVLEDFVSFEILDGMGTLELRISLSCPDPGEYALKIDVCNEDKQENACNYLVQTGKEKNRETYHQRKARRLLTEAMMTNDETMLTHALKACEESSLPVNDPEVNAGEKRLEYVLCKEGLKTALMVNRIDKSEETLHRVQQANLDRLFEKEIRRVKHHLKQLLSLDKDGWNSRIPEIDRISLMELGQLRQPKQPVKYVVMAMYMLLGVPQELMTGWSQIKALLRNKDTTLVEMARLENYLDMDSVEITSLDHTSMELVGEVLQTYSEYDVRRIDNTAAAYYNWVRMIHSKLKHRLKSRRVSTGRFDDDFHARRSVVSVTDRSQSKSVMSVRRHHSYKSSVTHEAVSNTFRNTSVKHEKDIGVFRSPSVKHEKDFDVFRSTSVNHKTLSSVFKSPSVKDEKDSGVCRGTSVKHEKDPDVFRGTSVNRGKVPNVFRGTSVKHEKGPDVFRGTSVNRGKVPDVFRGTSVKHEKDPDVFRGTSVNRGKVSDVFRGTSVKHEKDPDIFRGTSVKHEKDPDVFRGTSVKHEKGPDVFRGTSVNRGKVPDVFRGPSDSKEGVTITTRRDTKPNLNGQISNVSDVFRSQSEKQRKDFNVFRNPSVKQGNVSGVIKSQSFGSQTDGRMTHVAAKYDEGEPVSPNNRVNPNTRTLNGAVGNVSQNRESRKLLQKTDNVISDKSVSPRSERNNILSTKSRLSAVRISRKQPDSARVDRGHDESFTYISNIESYKQVNGTMIQTPSVKAYRGETSSLGVDSLSGKKDSFTKRDLNDRKNQRSFSKVVSKKSTPVPNRRDTQQKLNGQTLSFISKGNGSVNHSMGKSSIGSEIVMKDLQKGDMRKVENVSAVVDGNLQTSDRVHRSGKTLKVSPVQQKPEAQALDQRVKSNKASLNGTNTVLDGRLKTAMFRGSKIPNIKPLNISGEIKTNAKNVLEKSAVASSRNGISKDQTFVKNRSWSQSL